MNRYVFGVLAAIVVIVAAIILVFSRGGNDTSQTPEESGVLALVDYADTDATARLTIQGEIKGQNEYDEVRISINRNTRTIEHVRGYTGEVVTRKTFANTDEGFEVFLHALNNAGFTAEQKADYETEAGVCPFGNRFIYELTENGAERMRLWSVSCRRSEGNFAGAERDVRRLFEAQIPDYRDLTRDIDL